MDVCLKAATFEDKDRLVVALANSGYKVSAQYVERRMWDVPKPHWQVTIHDYEEAQG